MRLPLVFATIAGAASATGFAPLQLWPVLLAALAVLIQLVSKAPTLKRALLLGWLFGVGQFTVGLNWIAHAFTFQDQMPHWLGYPAVALLALYLALYPAVAAGLAWRWGRGRGDSFLFVFAAAWIVTEWLRASLFTGFAWNPLGVALVPLGVLPHLSTAVGTYGLSAIVVLAAGALWRLSRRRWLLGTGVLVPLAVLALLPKPALPASGPIIRVVQPNIDTFAKYDLSLESLNFAKLSALSGEPGPVARLILWPEGAIPEPPYLEESAFARRRLAALLGPRDVLMAGGTKRHRIRERQGDYVEEYTVGGRNSTYAIDARGRLLQRYDKAHLVPYGEYLPARPILEAIGLSRLVPGEIDFWPGPGPLTQAIPGFGAVGGQICYEIVFSGAVVDPTRRPDFIFNPSNDAWFGSWGPPQHLAQARLRAMEEGVPIVRATPTGISAVIDADGRLLATVPQGEAGFIETRLPPARSPTLFARFGNAIPLVLALILAALGVALRRRLR